MNKVIKETQLAFEEFNKCVKDRLTLHRDKIHLGKRFICHICGKELSDAKLLKGHKRRLHNE